MILLSTMLVAASLIVNAGIFDTKVIYGLDNRMEYSETPAGMQKLADSTFAMISKHSINGSSTYNMCEDEPFSGQRALASCSGFLVGKDLVATAGHCIKSSSDCDNYRWVRNYNDTTLVIDNADIYRCKGIVKQELSNSIDYAVIRLEREVTEVEPLELSNKILEERDELFVIGHPAGLPLKVADGASVRSIFDSYFLANLDTYGGNSGSAVFNSDTDKVVGILVRGETDYAWDSINRCRISNRCPDTGCSGEGVTKIKFVTVAIK